MRQAKQAVTPLFFHMTDIPVSKGTRLLNWCVDTALCGLIFLRLVRLFFPHQPDDEQLRWLKYGFLLLDFAYYLFCESVLGTTAGQFLTGTRILSFDGSAPSFATTLARTASRFIPFEPLAIFFSSSGQTLHDHIANTKTIHKHHHQTQNPTTP